MDHYEYISSLLAAADINKVPVEESKPPGMMTPREISLFYASLYKTGKAALRGSYDYMELIRRDGPFYKAVTDINKATVQALGAEIVSSLVCHEIYHYLCYEAAGKKTYEVAPLLTAALKETELRGLTASDLRFPYESILINVPPSSGFQVWSTETGWHNTRNICVTADGQEMHVMIVGESKNDNPGDNAVFYFDLPLISDIPLHEVAGRLSTQIQAIDNNKMLEQWKSHLNWIINVLMYITSSSVDAEVRTANKETRQLERRLQKAKGTKRAKIQSKLRTMNRRKITYLGEGLKPDLVKEATGMRHRVRGHWHKYWTGKGRVLLTTKWIQPYWKGEGKESNPVVRLTQ